jgi:hypothetical protein
VEKPFVRTHVDLFGKLLIKSELPVKQMKNDSTSGLKNSGSKRHIDDGSNFVPKFGHPPIFEKDTKLKKKRELSSLANLKNLQQRF